MSVALVGAIDPIVLTTVPARSSSSILTGARKSEPKIATTVSAVGLPRLGTISSTVGIGWATTRNALSSWPMPAVLGGSITVTS